MHTTPTARPKAKDRSRSGKTIAGRQDDGLAARALDAPDAVPAETNGEFSAITKAWHAAASIDSRRRLGQFMTPRALREALLDHLELWPGIRVLDPGVGTGEFLRSVLDREPRASCFGWDVDPAVLEVARRQVPEADLSEHSALDPYLGESFDLVIGNPPYFEFRPSFAVREQFRQVISGRPNIFALFFQAGLTVLKPGGRLAYVVPPSMNNGAYFDGLRDYIGGLGRVEWLRVYPTGDHFADAQTAVQLIVINGSPGPSPYVFRRDVSMAKFHRTIFSEQAKLIENEFVGRRTVFDYGYEAVTGTIVWNQHKEKLFRDAAGDRVALLWAQNIADGKLLLHASPRRPQYVQTDRVLQGPAIIVNRIVGQVGSGVLRCALVPEGMPFVGENHVNVIRRRPEAPQTVSWSALLELLRHPHVASRVALLTGNTQVSATELTHLLPIGA